MSVLKYTSLNEYLQRRFGCKVYKIALSGGMTCPNRDGTCGTRGCIFCSAGGSGDFAAPKTLSVTEQIEFGKKMLEEKLFNGRKEADRRMVKYIAYFQSFTNTYAPVGYLRTIFTEAVDNPEICVLSVATRPDCLDDEVIRLLAELNRRKPVWVELGLQTINEKTADFIRRGYGLHVFEDAVFRLRKAGIEVITHVILGLPGEDEDTMLATVKYLSTCDIQGIKLQLLHVLRHSDLGDMYLSELKKVLECKNGPEFCENLNTVLDSECNSDEFRQLYRSSIPEFNLCADKLGMVITSPEKYTDILVKAVSLLPKSVVIHRLTGDAPVKDLIYPIWSSDKKSILNSFSKKINM